MAAKITLKEMQNLIKQLTNIQQEPESAYQFICDYYYDFIASLEKNSQTKDEKDATGPVIAVLHRGANECPIWVTSSQCMNHFGVVSRTVRASLDTLDQLSQAVDKNASKGK